MKRNLALCISVLSVFTLTFAEAAYAEDRAPPLWRPPATVGAVASTGLSLEGLSGRVGVEGKGWAGRHFGFGGKALYGGDTGLFGVSSDFYLAEPEIYVQFGSRKVRWLSFVGAEIGTFRRTDRHVNWLCFSDPCAPDGPTTTAPWALMAGGSIGTGVEWTPGRFMLGANFELEANNVFGIGAMTNITIGISFGPH